MKPILGYVKFEGKIYAYVDKDDNGYLLLIDGEENWIGERMCEEFDYFGGNPILDNVKGLVDKQTEKGLKKYGETVNPDSYNLEEWIVHLQEELVDALVYTETLKVKVRQFKKIMGS